MTGLAIHTVRTTRQRMHRRASTKTLAIVGAVLLGNPAPVLAICNVIPEVRASFHGALRVVDRPFAPPADWVDVSLDSECAADSRGLAEDAADHVITIVFTHGRCRGTSVRGATAGAL